ncbi:hypothetical protein TH61_00500 [Rufibacter sp. DG15C]|nr:hypothetical protein TH61_00500 [Rufibacter sp. DG15C]
MTSPYGRLQKVMFPSTSHIRYENGHEVITPATDSSGRHVGCKRGVKIEPNIQGGDGYTITIYNMDGNHPDWGNNVQMAPKQMKIIKTEDNKTTLRGFGSDASGSSFADYGIVVFHSGNDIEKIRLQMLDRGIEIEYLK